MTALDWLRRQKAARRPLATGGTATPSSTPPLGFRPGCGLRAPAPSVQLEPADTAMARQLPAPNGANCGCWPRYTGCYCPDRDRSTR